jgi:hypothetical protein
MPARPARFVVAISTLIFAFAICGPAFAQSKGTYQAATSTPAGPATIPSNTGFLLGGIQPVQIVAGDFNGDGKQDFVAGASCSQGSANGQYGIPNCPSFNGSVIAAYIGNGDGTFQPAVLSAGPAPALRAIAVADFNGDGIPDVAAISDCNSSQDCSSGLLTIMLGNGDGTFRVAASYPVNGAVIGANTITTGVLTGDGHQDIVIGLGCDFSNSGCSTGAVLVFLGNGDGTFQTPKDYPTVGNQALPVVVGDFNKDSKQDVLLSSFVSPGGGSLIFFPGNGDGTLGTSVSTSLPGYAGGTALAAADFNSDGNLDAVTIAPNSVAVVFGNGDGTFQTATTYALNINAEEFPESIAVADMNGDGKPDIEVGEGQGTAPSAVGVLLNDGTGNFTNISNYSESGVESTSIAIADFNGDGKSDILIVNNLQGQSSSDGTINLLFGNGDGTFRSAQYVSVAGIGAGSGSVVAADFNGDGFQDLIVPVCPGGCNGNSGFALLLSDGAGGYQTPATFSTSTSEAAFVIAGDFNGDGKPDVALISGCDATCSGDAVSVFLNTGNGTFAAGVVSELGGLVPLAAATGDFNGDGKLDIAVLNQCQTPSTCGTEASVAVLLGNGDGTFQPAVTTPVAPNRSAFWLAAADLNHDGRTDLVVTETDTDDVNESSAQAAQVLLSNGDGTFALGGNFLTGGDAGGAQEGGGLGSTVAIGDVNGDGIPDLVVANNCDLDVVGGVVVDVACANGAIGVLLGNGDGTFQAATVTVVPDANFDGISLADVNADGKLDIVASVGSGIVVFLGNGNGTFQNPTTYSGGTSGGTNQMAIADLRNDGGADVVQSGSQLTIFYDQGFTLPSSTTTLQSSLNPSSYGQIVTFTATVTSTSGTPTGTVTFTVDGVQYESTSLSGSGTAVFSPLLNAGTHSIVASYSGDGDHSASNSAALSQTVNAAATTVQLISSANPAYVNQTVTLIAQITSQFGAPVTGSVTFKQGTTTLGTAPITFNKGVFSINFPTPGTRQITATYSGDNNDAGSASQTLRQVVDSLPAATKTVVTASALELFVGQPETFNAAVSSTDGPIPDGELVTFTNGTTTLATVPLSGGVAQFTPTSLAAGTYNIKASYPGDATFKPSSGTLKVTVILWPSVPSTPASNNNPSIYGQAVTLTTTVTTKGPNTPTGTLTFKNGATPLGTVTLDSTGTATLTKSNLPAGSLSIIATYNGDSENAKSTSLALAQTVTQASTTTTVTSSKNPSTLGNSVKFTATVASATTTPTGTVTFMDGTTVLATKSLSGGTANFTTSALSTGSHNITAVYAGTTNITGSTSPVLVQTVN